MKDYKLIIFDADGTLRECTIPGQPCPNKSGEWRLMFNVKRTLDQYDWSRMAFGVASNQAGIALGFLDQNTAYQLLCDMVVEATGHFPPTGSIRVCPHGTKDGCNCRKPAPGMLNDIMLFWDVLPGDTLYVGDMESDRQAAVNAGCDFQWSHEFFRPRVELTEEDNKYISEALTKLVALSKRETDECFLCGKKIERMSKVGRSVYARPCGCRLWQGTVPDAWKTRK